MERVGKFVIREKDGSINIYRIIGYDFERKKCIMKRISPLCNQWGDLQKSDDFTIVQDDDVLYSSDEAVAYVKTFIDKANRAKDVLSALSNGQCPKWSIMAKHNNYRIEFSHLYNALNNTLCNLHHYKRYTPNQAYRDYTKSLRNLRKRFYFYYGDGGKEFVDFMEIIANAYENPIKDKIVSIENNIRRKQKQLLLLEDYIHHVPEIRYV